MKRIHIAFSLSILLLASCAKQDRPLTDQELITAIESTTQITSVTIEDLPAEATAILESDYETSFTEEVLLAEDLGYLVRLRRTVSVCTGDRLQAYFDLEGRELRPIPTQRRVDCDNRDRCFRFVFPLTFTMPDGTEISGNYDDIHQGIRQWYANHPDAGERPQLQFPIQIYFEDPSDLTTIEDWDQLWRAYESCE